MSTNQTANYQLNQWTPEDQVLREEFNADNAKIDAAIRTLVPAGVIALWSGAVDAIPAGWALCDGTQGTPDLRGRFIVGAGNEDYPVGSTGGATQDTLSDFEESSGGIFGTYYAYASGTHDNRPPYYALCYIMRL